MHTNFVETDRWLEIDLYWFDRNDIDGSATRFWERFEPLMRGVTGWKGVVVNAGWLVDHVLSWGGDLSTPVPFPDGLVKDKFFSDTTALQGTVEERKAQWKKRFSERAQHDDDPYPAWTYGEFRSVAAALRRVAKECHGLEDLRVGTFVIGWNSIYQCEFSPWSQKHPEAFFKGPWVDQLLNVTAELQADPTSYAAFPHGINEGTPIAEVFGRQWGALSRDLSLDAIVLRDSMVGQGIYERTGPWGETAPEDPAKVARWSAATADLVRQTKLAAPDALVIGYSNAASAVADWRVNCVDLESIAREGHLDAWIDQTWAGAWNEVGQREDLFWNLPLQGWTNQLGFVLLRAAVLAGTPTRHYVLTETFDAWESWDIIHTARSRLAWGIWAYLHAFVKTPSGLTMPRGSYVSWLNQGKRLLSEADVDFLATEMNEAVADARTTTHVAGPTVVYSRDTMAHLCHTTPHVDVKEWVDEQIGFLLKFGVPCTSATRVEYLGQVESDLFILQTPNHLPPERKNALLDLLDSGSPVAIFGSAAGGVDPEIAKRLGVQAADALPSGWRSTARRVSSRYQDLPREFAIRHHWADTRLIADDAEVIYEVEGSPALVRRGKMLFWDPADVRHRVITYTGQWNWGTSRNDQPTAELMGSPAGWVMAAREITRMLTETSSFSASPSAWDDTAAVISWQRAGDQIVLVGELEEGFRNSTEGTWRTQLRHPELNFEVALSYGQAKLVTLRDGRIISTRDL